MYYENYIVEREVDINVPKKLIFGNGKTLPYLTSTEIEADYNGARRRVCIFICAPDTANTDTLNKILLEEKNTKSMQVKNIATGVVNLLEDFVIKCRCGTESLLVKAETPDNLAEYSDFIVVIMGKRTFLEQFLLDSKK